MSRISAKFSELRRRKEKALIVFMTAGDPSLKKNGELVPALEKEGVDLIELGVPFSDPLADGPVIQASSQRALRRRTNLVKILALVRKVRKHSRIPLIIMSYLNPILHYGFARFARNARSCGVDGLVVPDLPPEEGRELFSILKKAGIDLVYLVAPTSSPRRRRRIAAASRGFIYYVSLTGVTGMRRSLGELLGTRVSALKKIARLPVCVGFGVSKPAQAKIAARAADGVIIGSAVVDALARHPRLGARAFASAYVRPFARALGKETL